MSQKSPSEITPKQKVQDELFVWPWMAVVANIPVEYDENGKAVGESGKKLKDEWIKEGYNPDKVHPLWTRWGGHSGLAVVEFCKNWDGFAHAMMFVKAFEVNKHGRKEWYDRKIHRDDKLYAWIATDADHQSGDVLGKHLRKKGDLKTLSDIEKEDETKKSKLIMSLKTLIDDKNNRSEEIKRKIDSTDLRLHTVMKQKEVMTENFIADMKMLQEKSNEQLRRVFEQVQSNLLHKKADERMLELAEEQKKKADERMLELAQKQKREKEKFHQKIIELQKKADEKQRLVLQIEQVKGALKVMKELSSEDIEAMKKMESIQEALKKKEEELEGINELVETRKELIRGFMEPDGERDTVIGVKRMRRFCGKENHLVDSSRHPFKEIIDEEDQEIAKLRKFDAEEDPSGSYPLYELWNYKEEKPATLKDGVEALLRKWKAAGA